MSINYNSEDTMKTFYPIRVMLLILLLVPALVFVSGCGREEEAPDRERTPEDSMIGKRGPGGGWIFYDKGDDKGGWRYMEAAPRPLRYKAEWGCFGKSISGARGTSVGTGKSNTEAIIKACDEPDIAAKAAAAYRGGRKTDWFLPSRDELNLIYENLSSEGIGRFAGFYWSSTQGLADVAWSQCLGGRRIGKQYYTRKHGLRRVHPVRRF